MKELFQSANAEAPVKLQDHQRTDYMKLKLEGISDAPVNICVTCDRKRAGEIVLGRTHVLETDLYSTVCAVQNLWLAARSEGISVGWVSINDEAKLKALLKIPDAQVVVAYLGVGRVNEIYASPELAAKGWRQRINLAELVHFDGWHGHQSSNDFAKALTAAAQAFVEQGCFKP